MDFGLYDRVKIIKHGRYAYPFDVGAIGHIIEMRSDGAIVQWHDGSCGFTFDCLELVEKAQPIPKLFPIYERNGWQIAIGKERWYWDDRFCLLYGGAVLCWYPEGTTQADIEANFILMGISDFDPTSIRRMADFISGKAIEVTR